VTTGTSNDLYGYTVVTNLAATKLEFRYNGNVNVYTVTATGSLPNFAPTASATVSADKKTWQITGDQLAVGSRTITVTAYDSAGKASAAKSFQITVSTPPAIAITSATPTKTSGTSSDYYGYKVVTNVAASRLEFRYNGNANVYTVKATGPLPNFASTASATVSADKRTWEVKNDLLAAGNRTITVTAYDLDGKASPAKSFQITVK